MNDDRFELAKNFFLKGLHLIEKGHFFDAELQFQESLKIIPNRSSTLLNLMIALFNQDKYFEAIACGTKAVEIEDGMVEAWFYLGLSANEIGEYEKGLEYLSKAVDINPNLVQAYLLKIEMLEKMGRSIDALEMYSKVLEIDAQLIEVWCNQGNLLLTLGRHEGALKCYDSAIQLDPKNHLAWINRSICLKDLLGLQQSLDSFSKAKEIFPDSFDVWLNEGALLCDLKKYDQALISISKALEIDLRSEKGWLNKANCLIGLQHYEGAIAACDEAIKLKPDFYQAWLNKGNALYEMKYFERALVNYDEALKYAPAAYEVLISRGRVLDRLKRYDEAILAYNQAIASCPNADWAFGELLSIKMKICSWSELDRDLKILIDRIGGNEKVITPFPLLALLDDPALHKKSAEIFIKDRYLGDHVFGPFFKKVKKEKLRVGYFSADFRNHPVSFLTAELFELHNQKQFEIIAFSSGPDDQSTMRLRLSKAFNQFIDVSTMSDLELAQFAREMDLDIAVDLGGLTADGRGNIFAYRIAPIQISYLGYLGTIGADYYDYILADQTIVPENLQNFYFENIAYLPSYQANDRKRIISDKQFTRLELGLPERGFIFCCFNSNYKILPSIFDSWMRILKAVEGSVLFLYAENDLSKANLINEAKIRGVSGGRLIFGGRIPVEEYLARYRVCDLFLDTFPYNAGTTSSDALWTGLPVLTLIGQSFASRVAASLLNAIGLPELIMNTQEEYEALAIELAMNPKKLTNIKLKLANNRLTTHLFDTPLFTKNLEATYIKMYERYRTNLQPDRLSLY
jgi:predicted O-linked N-acetylglucosamine transferase (SPINDLY family)